MAALAIGVLAATGGAQAGYAPVPVRKYDLKARQQLIAHEWGTVLNVQGSDGAILDGLYFKKEWGVPEFVYHLFRNPPLTTGQRGIAIKPILYFYAPEPVEVRVTIEAAEGRWLEWWPKAEHSGTYNLQRKAIEEDPTAGRVLKWWGEIIPKGHDEHEIFLEALKQVKDKESWYPLARLPDAAIFRGRFEYPWTNEVEKFLFYRGASEFAPPLRAWREGPNLQVKNVSGEAVQLLCYVERPREGAGTSLRIFDDVTIRAGKVWTRAVHKDEAPEPELDAATRGQRELARMVKAAGLTEAEADSMSRIWAAEYFRSPGTRLFYRIPKKTLQDAMPLKIEPEPKELVRVQIGWLELLSPEDQKDLRRLVRDFEDDKTRSKAAQALRARGFVAHPFMWEGFQSAEDAEAKAAFKEWFEE